MGKTSTANDAYTHELIIGIEKLTDSVVDAYSTVSVRHRGPKAAILHLCTNALTRKNSMHIRAYWMSVRLPEPKDPLNSMPTAQQFPARNNVVLRLAA
jgi:hypothetical protein